MSGSSTKTAPAVEARAGGPAAPPEKRRHIVELAPGQRILYRDKALCGYEWDRVGVTPDGEMCADCDRIYRYRTGRG
jgi:hypothetical protein